MSRTTQVGPSHRNVRAPGSAGSPTPRSRRSRHVSLRDLTVEWAGCYSVDKTLALFAYTKACSWKTVLAWLLLTPFIALATPLLVELLPLNDPRLGLRANWTYLVRVAIRAAMIAFAIDCQNDLYIPEQKQPLVSLILMNCIQGSIMAAAITAIASIVGVFPVPFVTLPSALIYAFLSWIIRSIFIRLVLPREKDPVRIKRIQRRLPQVMRLTSFGLILMYIYNAFATAFSNVPPHFHVPMTVVLQVIKVAVSRHQWKLSHIGEDNEKGAQTIGGDMAIAHVASGARFFHSLFTTTCLQTSKSHLTLGFIIGFSLLQDLGSIRGLEERAHAVASALQSLGRTADKRASGTQHAGFQETLLCIAERTRMQEELPRPYPELTKDRSFYVFRQQADVALASQSSSSSMLCSHRQTQQPPSPQETALLQCASRLLHCREAVLLRLYVETFVPLIYFAYLTVIQTLPNIQYLPQQRVNEADDLTALGYRLAVQAAVKLVTFVFILIRLGRKPSGLSHLAFALSSMHTVIFGGCVLNALAVFDFPLLHNGYDFTFQFKWLHHPTATT